MLILMILWQDIQFFEYLGNMFKGIIYLLLGMGGHQRIADKRVARGNRRRYDRIDKDALFKQEFGDKECLIVVTHIERHNRCCRRPQFKPSLFELIDRVMGELPQILHPFGFRFQYIQRG